ncbi:hypothetical protein EOI86_17595 [Hwanghaeella grinnelliae]|uniref:Uncharacterized protein n=1 Tax=Hwanghaeella grinnelliae TaxID=2500179 RepID=A0A437QJK3_9PROT|nr:hypothetical protein [Hwanghaeella grinnelliae]RVU34670.1 hypothetical protein EOI86_17595 [Hwanghaeella grinnelliae]
MTRVSLFFEAEKFVLFQLVDGVFRASHPGQIVLSTYVLAVSQQQKGFVAMVQKINSEEARQGEKSGVVRYVLAASLALAVIAVAVVGFGTAG